MTAERPTTEQLSTWLKETAHSPYAAKSTVGQVVAQLERHTGPAAVQPAITLAPRRRPRVAATTLAALAASVLLVVLAAALVTRWLDPGDGDVAPAHVPEASASALPTTTPGPSPTVQPSMAPAPAATTGLREAPGSMSDAGSLAVPRKEHTATPLDDGRVLVIGGQGGGRQAQPLVDLWDPGTGGFRRSSNLQIDRTHHTATRLADGRVLITGGHTRQGPSHLMASIEIWDPSTQTSHLLNGLLEPRADHTATLLPDGRVLIVGGHHPDSRFGERATAEIWDPATETSSMTDTLEHGRSLHTATLLPDGRVLIAGGVASRFQPGGEMSPVTTASLEIWDPGTGEFTELAEMATPRYLHTASLLSDGRVLIAGGSTNDEEHGLSSIEVWDPRTEQLTAGGPLEFARVGHTATVLDDDRVLFVGGTVMERAELWDPTTETTARAGTTEPPRQFHTATLLADGRVLVVAGRQVSRTRHNLGPVASAQLWAPIAPQASSDEGPLLDPASALTGDAVLARRFPASIDGQVLTVATRTFETWHADLDPELEADAAFRAEIEAYAAQAGVEMADITLATATHWQDRNAHAIAAVRIPGVDVGALVGPTIELMLGHIVEPTVERIEIAGRSVARVRDASLPGAYPSYAYAEGDTIWLVQSEEPILSEVFAALP